jgi:Putative Flp pilus-assembly TadE/G-like
MKRQPNLLRTKRGERGFVTVSTAIVLTLLLMCAALALDVAIWFARANELQRTADAAALAGVVQMPDQDGARIAAVEIATKNRVAAANVTVETIPDAPRELRVSVKDPNVRSFFGRFASNGIGLERTSTAEYVPKIELGSRLNAIGTGDLPGGWGPGGTDQNFWLAINGKCSPKEDGDRFGSAFDGNRKATGEIWCDSTGGTKNSEYRRETDSFTPSDGASNEPTYTYVVDVPCPTVLVAGVCTTPVNAHIDVYNPYFDNSTDNTTAPTRIDTNVVRTKLPTNAPAGLAAIAGFETVFRIRDLETDNPLPAYPNASKYGTCTDCAVANNQWYTLYNVPAGQYRVDISTEANPNAYGSNAFSLRVWSGPTPAPCDAAGCPSIAGQSSMSVFANIGNGQADFFLARLAPARYYRGKKIQVLLFDPGEGASSIQLMNPVWGPGPVATRTSSYQPISFRYRTWNPGLDGFLTDTGVPVTATDPAAQHKLVVSGPGLGSGKEAPWWVATPPILPANDSLYNGRLVSLEVQIPPGYGCVDGEIPCVEDPVAEDGWWKIRYTTNQPNVGDRTTWSVRMFGDPVHLTNN